METLLGVIVGIGLAAACGFRVFAPLLVMSIAVHAGHLDLSEGWLWIGSWPALISFAVATVAEVAGYYLPWVDNLLDTIATPAAVIAGTMVTASCVSEMSPWLQWATAAIAGGGTAGVVQTGTVVVRGVSSATTAGLGNFVVSSLEFVCSLLMAVLAVLIPIMAMILVLVIVALAVRYIVRRKPAQPQPVASS